MDGRQSPNPTGNEQRERRPDLPGPPPFNSNRDYSAPIGSEAAGAAFKDTWTLEDVDEAWHGEVAEQNPAVYSVIGTAGEAHGRALKSYLIMMAVRLLEMRRILKPTGSIYLHCDPTASHYLKLLLDRVAPTFVLKYNIRIRSLADQSAIEDVLAVEDDVVPFDRADVLGAGLRQGLPW